MRDIYATDLDKARVLEAGGVVRVREVGGAVETSQGRALVETASALNAGRKSRISLVSAVWIKPVQIAE